MWVLVSFNSHVDAHDSHVIATSKSISRKLSYYVALMGTWLFGDPTFALVTIAPVMIFPTTESYIEWG